MKSKTVIDFDLGEFKDPNPERTARIVNSKAFLEKGRREARKMYAKVDYAAEIAKAIEDVKNAKTEGQKWNANSMLQTLIHQKAQGYGNS